MSGVGPIVARLGEALGIEVPPLPAPSGLPVVVVAGGTGSGKSSLVNALAGRVVTDVGALRPTTDEAVAVLPTDGDGRLPRLEALGVVRREQGDHEGFVLVDLPDFDSVVVGHRELARAVLGVADVAIWVVDPEKYADASVHDAMAAHADIPSIVVCGHADRLSGPDRLAVLDDLRRLVGGRQVLAVALPPGGPAVGVDAVRAALATVGPLPVLHATRAAATRLLEQVGPVPDPPPDEAWAAVEDVASSAVRSVTEPVTDRLVAEGRRLALVGRRPDGDDDRKRDPDLGTPEDWDAAIPLLAGPLDQWGVAAERLRTAVEAADVLASSAVVHPRRAWSVTRWVVAVGAVLALVAGMVLGEPWSWVGGAVALVGVLTGARWLWTVGTSAGEAAADAVAGEARSVLESALEHPDMVAQRHRCARAATIGALAAELAAALDPASVPES
ncbi:MAG: GTPase [Acidimicrobiia bacterium]